MSFLHFNYRISLVALFLMFSLFGSSAVYASTTGDTVEIGGIYYLLGSLLYSHISPPPGTVYPSLEAAAPFIYIYIETISGLDYANVYSFTIVPAPEPPPASGGAAIDPLVITQSLSFFLGALSAMAFTIASSSRL